MFQHVFLFCQLSTNDPLIYLNYATFLLREGERERATEMASKCSDAVAAWEAAGRSVDVPVRACRIITNIHYLLRSMSF